MYELWSLYITYTNSTYLYYLLWNSPIHPATSWSTCPFSVQHKKWWYSSQTSMKSLSTIFHNEDDSSNYEINCFISLTLHKLLLIEIQMIDSVNLSLNLAMMDIFHHQNQDLSRVSVLSTNKLTELSNLSPKRWIITYHFLVRLYLLL